MPPSDRVLKNLARFGLASRGLVYLLLALVAVKIAAGQTGTAADQRGVFEAIARQPLGRVLLLAVAAGYGCLAVWEGFNATREMRGRVRRVAAGAKCIIYLVLSGSALAVVASFHLRSENKEVVDVTGRVMLHPGGRLLVGAVGLGLIVGGILLARQGVVRAYGGEIDLASASPGWRRAVDWAGVVGMAARGLVAGALGYFVLDSAVTFDPGHAKGIDGALRTLVHQPYGPLWLFGVAVGLAAFGTFSLLEIRFVKP
ncbi:MAG TPA: DUF1206 domain-containing protein [Actinomycetota bacterium]|nr:DUF1206 domain-containing protein [Actinomycetota bacterium]